MGRTNPTYRDYIRRAADDWRPYRRALRRQYTPAYDALFDYSRDFADAGGNLNRSDPELTLLFSMLLGVEVHRRQLAERVADLEAEAGEGDEVDADG